MAKFSLFKPKLSTGKKVGNFVSKALIYTILIMISIIWICPFLYLLIQSFAPEYSASVLIPPIETWTLDHYRALFDPEFVQVINGKEVVIAKTYPFWRWYLNTLVIALITSVLQTVLTLMSAYAFSRLKFKTRKNYMKLILVIGMFPGFLGMIINYNVLYYLNLATGFNAMIGLILVYIGGCVMNYYVAKGFFDTISKSLDEAAMIDGANKNTIFWQVIMPLSKPIIVYTILLAFTAPWGDYMFASVMAQGDTKLFNVAVGLQQMMTKEAGQTYFPIFCAAGVLVSIPIVILFFCLQNYYVEGVTGGAVKG